MFKQNNTDMLVESLKQQIAMQASQLEKEKQVATLLEVALGDSRERERRITARIEQYRKCIVLATRKEAARVTSNIVSQLAVWTKIEEDELRESAFHAMSEKMRERKNGINTVIKKGLANRYANINDLDVTKDVPGNECFSAIITAGNPEMCKDLAFTALSIAFDKVIQES